ncbi:type I restriction-modification system subunit M [Leptospira levettii]|uniref:type I restriction-modification system subunit M n=1 Tax=Leptospira levettii TaxID=2023178 RepID=UPI001EEB0C42|nr:class I SAM-dependent DNA methyltransferase [Leptospira levettii]MCG6149986.1 type I restriction-modification system subunit M [Leptospira levettii]MCW7506445.1 type I restriction-modification system subunit M [Leptospira levettii]MCW7517535.1 type I restriction-modification system subunit M [Leptospira levettii]
MVSFNNTLKSLIDKLWNNFWSGGISNPLTAIEQITYLIFMKRIDDLDAKRVRDAEFTEEPYVSRFHGKYKVPGSSESINKSELRWSTFKHKPAEEMLLHVQTKVFPFLKELDGGYPFTKSMANAVFIMPKPSLLVEAIHIIEQIFDEIERDASVGGHAFQDIQGDVYEMLLSEIATSGKNGQFRTPRHIIKLMAELVSPQLGQRVADPACGTGGFLLGAYQYILTDLAKKNQKSKTAKVTEVDEDGFERAVISSGLTEKAKAILESSFYGFDIDTTMVRLGLMNLMMHGIDQPQIDYKDTLSKSYNEDSQFDVVLANPPFTGNIDKGDINEGFTLPTTKTELLFVERIYRMLKIGGTAAVIVPQGVLFGSGKAFVEARKILVDKSELKAVITMPSGVFKPYAGVSTAILVFTKGGETENVWFYDMVADGYTLDDKRTKIETSDLPDIVTQFKTRDPKKPNDRKAKYFFVPKAEIVAEGYDLSMSKFKEDVFEEVSYESPKVILEKLKGLEKEIGKGLEELEGMIG